MIDWLTNSRWDYNTIVRDRRIRGNKNDAVITFWTKQRCCFKNPML